jgi:peptidoglycan/LPS O-acetylase OafA/YrhL
MLLLVIGIAAANALGLLIHKGIESPLTRFLKKKSPFKALQTQAAAG